jgi:hypothetical protein
MVDSVHPFNQPSIPPVIAPIQVISGEGRGLVGDPQQSLSRHLEGQQGICLDDLGGHPKGAELLLKFHIQRRCCGSGQTKKVSACVCLQEGV